MTTKIPLLLSQLLLVTAALGCASKPGLLTPPNSADLNLVKRELVQEVSVVPISNSVIVGPGERITIRTSLSDQVRYLCHNRLPLLCDRLNRNLYCFCPGSRQPT